MYGHSIEHPALLCLCSCGQPALIQRPHISGQLLWFQRRRQSVRILADPGRLLIRTGRQNRKQIFRRGFLSIPSVYFRERQALNPLYLFLPAAPEDLRRQTLLGPLRPSGPVRSFRFLFQRFGQRRQRSCQLFILLPSVCLLDGLQAGGIPPFFQKQDGKLPFFHLL